MPQSYTLDQLRQMGAKPRSYTINELQQMGAKPVATANPNQAILDRQKAQFPTSEELGGTSGAMIQPQIDMNDPNRTAGQVALDQMSRVGPGVASVVTGIPGFLKSGAEALGQMVTGGGTGKGQEMIRGMVASTIDPLKTILRGADVGPFLPRGTQAFAAGTDTSLTPTDSPEWPQAAEGAGAMLGGTLLPVAVKGATKAAKALPPAVQAAIEKNPALRKVFEARANKFQAGAEVNTAKSLRPVTLEDQAITKKIAPELSKRGIRGVTGNSIDKKLFSNLDEATNHLSKVEQRLASDPRPEMQVHMKPLVAKVDSAINKLKVKGTQISANPQAVAALERVKKLFEALPEYADFDQVLDLRRKLDSAVDDAGGFRESASAADRVTMKAQRGGADIVRQALNQLDPALKKANQDFSLYRHAVDVVDRRLLGDVGKTGRNLPGRASVLDDLLAGWAGEAIGGTTGAVLLETLNLTRQTRGYASVKGATQQKLADILRPKVKEPKLLPAGPSRLSAPDSSGIRVETGKPIAPIARSYDDMVTTQSSRKVKTGPAKGMTLSHIDMDPLTGDPKGYTYIDASGKKLRFSTIQE